MYYYQIFYDFNCIFYFICFYTFFAKHLLEEIQSLSRKIQNILVKDDLYIKEGFNLTKEYYTTIDHELANISDKIEKLKQQITNNSLNFNDSQSIYALTNQ